jgi:hypothetical protein
MKCVGYVNHKNRVNASISKDIYLRRNEKRVESG